MSITTFSELKTAVASWLNRDDLTAIIPDFISMAEATHNRLLRHWEMETRASVSFTARYYDLPSDWRQPIRVTVGNKAVKPISLTDIMDMREEQEDASGEPCFYSVSGGQLELFPTPDGTYAGTLLYYASVPALSDAAPTNWLLTAYPDVYLYGALVHSAPFLHEDQRIATWAALHQSAIEAANRESDNSKTGGAGLSVKIRSY